jgi:hypothetical protein
MIEEALANYGVLGLWTITLLTERFIANKKTATIIENNTIAMTKVYDIISRCPRTRKV